LGSPRPKRGALPNCAAARKGGVYGGRRATVVTPETYPLDRTTERQSPGTCTECDGPATIYSTALKVEESTTPIIRQVGIACPTPGCRNFRED